MNQDLTSWSACALSQAIHQKTVSCREVMQAHLRRIAVLNPRFNAIVSLVDESRLLAQADECDSELARGHSRGWMHGFPLAVKDLVLSQGVRTTLGSPLMANFVPNQDSTTLARMKAAGAIVIGKTNTPEFGLGSHTFNEVFGPTRNAYDPSRSAGGSSGGAAVALALDLVPVADGSDFMGSLRNPAGWNHIYAMRPSQGRIPMEPALDVWVSQLGTDGPMARTVSDLAHLLCIQSGHSAQSPLSLTEGLPPASSLTPLPLQGVKLGWLGNLEGYLPMEDGVLQTCEASLKRLSDAGATVQPMGLGHDPHRVWDCWLAWRKVLVASRLAPFLLQPANRERMKPEALWEADQAQGLSANDFLSASVERTRFYHHLLSLFDKVDFLVLPSAQVWPFPIEWRWPASIRTANGDVQMDTYHRWMEVVIYATLGGLPAISLPAGFGPQGLPMGLQVMAKPMAEAHLLRLALAHESLVTDVLNQKPQAAMIDVT
ncbi:MAG: amidase [Betaproteobacteria bacterium]|jgi:amidase|nr:amidase [Betaproteobacteria bacterium]NBP45012.1 amidase [Betaproteobacteria bacterium]